MQEFSQQLAEIVLPGRGPQEIFVARWIIVIAFNVYYTSPPPGYSHRREFKPRPTPPGYPQGAPLLWTNETPRA